jgi:acyl-coenzyme A synthetase/AMP-(fatty) acid ligase
MGQRPLSRVLLRHSDDGRGDADVNVNLIPEDIAYTINDTCATTVLFNADFLPLMEKLKDHLKAVKNYVFMHDRPEPPQTDFPINSEYEALLSLGSQYFPFPDFDENAWATVFHTTGTTGRPREPISAITR